MSYVTSKMQVLASALVVMGSFGLVSTAEARASTKVWDPVYGVDLPNLGWSGRVTFDVADSCLATVTTGWVDNYGSNAACFNQLKIKSSTVTLYDVLDPSGTPGPAGDVTLSYGSSLFTDYNLPVTLRMYIEDTGTDKVLRAVQGGFLFPEFTNASFAKVAGYDGAAFWLNFNANIYNDFSSDVLQGDYAFLTSCSYKTGAEPGRGEEYKSYKSHHSGLDVACSQNDGIDNPAVLRPVPEPEAYLLGLASFGVLGVWARRRRISAG